MIIVSRTINGISINGYENLLNADGTLMKFVSKESAVAFLQSNGITSKELESLNFEEEI